MSENITFADLTFKCSERVFNKIRKELDKLKLSEEWYVGSVFTLKYCRETEKGLLQLLDYEVIWDIKSRLINLSKILHKSKLQLKGFYLGKQDNDFYRVDVFPVKQAPYIKIEKEGASWILYYNVKQIKELHKIAEKKFK